ncbi:hypothetical protein MGYG_07546 [Nannizzia gypsea CBS 118893]|uniref:Uncharacterized protein n=1 Tax=Arthroderma gypseum (strain ATCC MYA-4604 / CBS 118893) TaxID=535722 RepID=E4V3G7_ARTGP|nr:hypothetical protein MGYG_07546 [Nannizzia gypsea CBS 118893]EFR04541.1 hypothetical protein MGYG_07546 [Nannizzia gypsea CBS 118893]
MQNDTLDALKAYFDKVYTDNDILLGLLNSCDDDKDHPPEYTASQGFKFNSDDWKAFITLVDAGPNFELRVAGGVYRFDSNAMGFWELMVHSATGKIYVDGNLVTSQSVDNQGWVTFTTASSDNFRVQFQCEFPTQDPPVTPGFSGETWKSENVGQKTSITAKRYHPWGNCLEKECTSQMISNPRSDVSEETAVAAVNVREDAAAESLAMALDLIGIQKKPTGLSTAATTVNSVDKGDLFLGTFHLLFTVAAAGVGVLYFQLIGGAVGTAAGGFSIGFITALRNYGIEGCSRGLKTDVKLTYVDFDQMLDERIREVVGKLSLEQTRDPDLSKIVKEKLEGNYKLYLHEKLDDGVYKRYRYFRKYWTREFKEAYAAAVKEKCEEQVPSIEVESLLQRYIDKKMADHVLPDDILKLGDEIKSEETDRDKKLSQITDPPGTPEWRAKAKVIKDEFEKKAKDIQDDIDKKTKDKTEREERSTELKLKEARKEVTEEMDRRRKEYNQGRIRKELEGLIP